MEELNPSEISEVIKQKIEDYTRMIFDGSDNSEKIKNLWHAMLKYSMIKDPFDVTVSVQDKQIPYGYGYSLSWHVKGFEYVLLCGGCVWTVLRGLCCMDCVI